MDFLRSCKEVLVRAVNDWENFTKYTFLRVLDIENFNNEKWTAPYLILR